MAQQRSANVLIRAARREDLRQLSALLADSFHPREGVAGLLQPLLQFGIREDLRYRLQQPATQYVCLTAVGSLSPSSTGSRLSQIIGTLELSVRRQLWWTGDRHVYISNVAVDRRFRRRGVARKLLQASEGVSRSWGLSNLSLHVMADNAAARQLYGQAGYTVADSKRSFDIPFQSSKRILLQKDIS